MTNTQKIITENKKASETPVTNTQLKVIGAMWHKSGKNQDFYTIKLDSGESYLVFLNKYKTSQDNKPHYIIYKSE